MMRTVTVLLLGNAVLLASQLGSAQTPSASSSPSAFGTMADPAMRRVRVLHRGGQSSNASPYYELSPCGRPTVAGRRSTSPSTDGHARGGRCRHRRQPSPGSTRTPLHVVERRALPRRPCGPSAFQLAPVGSASRQINGRASQRLKDPRRGGGDAGACSRARCAR